MALVLLPSCYISPNTPATEKQVVVVARESFREHWRSVELRIPTWFQSQGMEAPALLPWEEVYAAVRFEEFRALDGSTCYFRPPDLIQIGDDKWASGCVPHEIGHAVLWMMKHPQWCNFEHPEETWKPCKSK